MDPLEFLKKHMKGGKDAALPIKRGRELLNDANKTELSPPPTTGDLLDRVLSGSARVTPEGECYQTERFFNAHQLHGNTRIEVLAGLSAVKLEPLLRAVTEDLLDSADGKVVFLDTETTGLAGGTGTVAFLVGAGWVEPSGGFVVRQYFMRSFDEEEAMLTALNEDLCQAAMLVTYNGATFDLPLLRNRGIMSGVRLPWLERPHLDLLPWARRLYKSKFGGAHLGLIEQKLFDLEREDDVPGWMVPKLYFDYIHTGRAAPLRNVFVHNAYDLVSLALLAVRVLEVGTDPERVPEPYTSEVVGVARSWLAQNRSVEACRLLETLLNSSDCDEYHRLLAMELVSFAYKRAEHWERAVYWWHQRLELDKTLTHIPCQVYPYMELAKYYEHRARDYVQAQKIVEELLARAPAQYAVPDVGSEYVYEEITDDRYYHNAEFEWGDDQQAFAKLSGTLWSEALVANLHHRLERIRKKIASSCLAQE